jgi:U3 small nucleolar RNA-associated protein 14
MSTSFLAKHFNFQYNFKQKNILFNKTIVAENHRSHQTVIGLNRSTEPLSAPHYVKLN